MVLQVAALDVLHHQVMDLALVVEVVGPHDVAMIERGGGLAFEMEAGQVRRRRRRGSAAAP